MPHIIKDSIHKDIEVSDLELEVLDSPAMQRLRRIRQLGMTNLVYPSATHTRFEHSLGAMHVAGRISASLGFGSEDTAHVRMAALLHDVWHHVLDEKGLFESGKNHGNLGAEIISREFSAILESGGLSPKKIAEAASGKGKFGSLLSGGIDIDKMDYLVRDAYFTGVAYGMVDLTRLYYTARFNGGLGFGMKALRNIEAVVVSRFMMFQSVYLHPAIRCADSMLIRAVENALGKKVFTGEDLAAMDDIDLLAALRRGKQKIGPLVEALDSRKLYKVASELKVCELDESLQKRISKIGADPKKQRELSDVLAARLGLANGQVLVNISSMKPLEAVKIIDEDKVFELKDVSSFARSVMEQEVNSGSVLISVPERYREKAKDTGTVLLKLL